jgi:hypothetical protein
MSASTPTKPNAPIFRTVSDALPAAPTFCVGLEPSTGYDKVNGGDLEKAQQMAAHESPRTTKLYDRRSDIVSLDEVEKVVF